MKQLVSIVYTFIFLCLNSDVSKNVKNQFVVGILCELQSGLLKNLNHSWLLLPAFLCLLLEGMNLSGILEYYEIVRSKKKVNITHSLKYK